MRAFFLHQQMVFGFCFWMMAGCATVQTPANSQKPLTQKHEGAESSKSADSGHVRTAASVRNLSADLSEELIAELTVSNMDQSLDRLLSYFQSEIPPTLFAMWQNRALRKQMLTAQLDLSGMENVIDLGRPLIVSLLAPVLFPSNEDQAVLFTIPLMDEQTAKEWMASQPGGLIAAESGTFAFSLRQKRFYVLFEDGYAFIAFAPDLCLATKLAFAKKPRNAQSNEAELSVNINNVRKFYAQEMEEWIEDIQQGMEQDNMYSLVSMQRWIDNFRSMKEGSLHFRFDPSFVEVGLDIEAQPQGAFSKFLQEMKQGDFWGMEYFPEDSLIVSSAHYSTEELRSSVVESMDLFREMFSGSASPALAEKYKSSEKTFENLLEVMAQQLQGPVSFALTDDASGALTFLHVTKVLEGSTSEYLQGQLFKNLNPVLKDYVHKVIQEEFPEIEGFDFDLKVKTQAFLLSKGLQGSRLDVDIAWPRLKDPQQKKELARLKKGLQKLFGKKLQAGFVSTEGILLFSIGKNYLKELKRMTAIAKGGRGSRLPQRLSPLFIEKPFSSFTVVSLNRLVRTMAEIVFALDMISNEDKDEALGLFPADENGTSSVWMTTRKNNETMYWNLRFTLDSIRGMLRHHFMMGG